MHQRIKARTIQDASEAAIVAAMRRRSPSTVIPVTILSRVPKAASGTVPAV
jgi:hypothetical protein